MQFNIIGAQIVLQLVGEMDQADSLGSMGGLGSHRKVRSQAAWYVCLYG